MPRHSALPITSELILAAIVMRPPPGGYFLSLLPPCFQLFPASCEDMAEVYRPDGAHDSEKGWIPRSNRDFLDFSGMCVGRDRNVAMSAGHPGATPTRLSGIFTCGPAALSPLPGPWGTAPATASKSRRQPQGFPSCSGDLINARMETLKGRW